MLKKIVCKLVAMLLDKNNLFCDHVGWFFLHATTRIWGKENNRHIKTFCFRQHLCTLYLYIVYPFVIFHLTIVLFVRFRFTASDFTPLKFADYFRNATNAHTMKCLFW